METDSFLAKIVLTGTMMRLLYPLPQGPLCKKTAVSKTMYNSCYIINNSSE